MITFEEIKSFLKNYDGDTVTLMEICGTHTNVIAKSGVKSMLSEKIRLISGPGCPVCVTVSAYIDRLCELAMKENTTIVTFGDMIRVRGSKQCLGDVLACGGSVKMVYSPFEIIELAKADANQTFVFAAVGFETTTPIYAMLLQKVIELNIKNIKLLTSIKIMPPAIEWICMQNSKIDGFISPGHVCTLTGYGILKPFAENYKIPFVVAGFTPEQVLSAIYLLIKLKGKGKVENLYRSAVSEDPNFEAKKLVEEYFAVGNSSWRGLGEVENSGLYLKDKYSQFDCGSFGLTADTGYNNACRCGEVIIGKISSKDCPLFGKLCTPQNPQGACMVSEEGTCHSVFNS